MAEGFVPHHVGDGFIMMTAWLAPGKSRLPPAAKHYLGVAGFVMDGAGRLLVVKEKTGPASQIKLWKLPGGKYSSPIC